MSSLYKNLNHLIWISITQVLILTIRITPVQGTVMRKVSGTELFPYFNEFSVTMGTKFGYNSFMEVVFLEV